MSDKLKFIILKEKAADIRQYEMSAKMIRWLAASAVIAFPLLLYLGAQLFLETAYSHRIDKLRKDNENLHELVAQFEDRIDYLEGELDELTVLDRDLRVHASLPDLPEDIRRVGIGGSLTEEKTNMDYLLPDDDISLAAITDNLNALYRGIKLEKISYEEIQNTLLGRIERLRTTPSIRPLDAGRYSSGYGYRRDPYSGQIEFHKGQDISARIGTPVISVAEGRISAARYNRDWGRYIKIDHGNGFITLYGHLNKILVRPGQKVSRGTLIGEVGNTGRSTGPHLHYEVRHYNVPQNPANYFF